MTVTLWASVMCVCVCVCVCVQDLQKKLESGNLDAREVERAKAGQVRETILSLPPPSPSPSPSPFSLFNPHLRLTTCSHYRKQTTQMVYQSVVQTPCALPCVRTLLKVVISTWM